MRFFSFFFFCSAFVVNKSEYNVTCHPAQPNAPQSGKHIGPTFYRLLQAYGKSDMIGWFVYQDDVIIVITVSSISCVSVSAWTRWTVQCPLRAQSTVTRGPRASSVMTTAARQTMTSLVTSEDHPQRPRPERQSGSDVLTHIGRGGRCPTPIPEVRR